MYYQEYVSPIGKMYMTSDGEYLTGLFFNDSRDSFKKALDERKELPIFLETKRWLDIYFKGEDPNFTPSYRIENLTPFRKDVLDQIKKRYVLRILHLISLLPVFPVHLYRLSAPILLVPVLLHWRDIYLFLLSDHPDSIMPVLVRSLPSLLLGY